MYAEGVNVGIPGTALLKVDPNAMYIEFYNNGVKVEDDDFGIVYNTEVLYTTVLTNMMRFVPFSEYYNDFTFDQTKNAYVAENLTSTLVDDYNPNETEDIYTKNAEVSFVNGYLNTISIEICQDATFGDVVASFVFTFSNINNTTVEL